MRFRDKVVVVTGAGSGIGEGIAEEFGKEGAMVVIAEIDSASGQGAEQRLTGKDIRAAFMQTDVSDERSVISAAGQIAARFGGIDVLINNAGISLLKGFLDTSAAEWDRVMGVDLKGVFLMSKYCVPLFKPSAVRSIVNISSVHALETIPNVDAYVAAKGGVAALTRSMALSLAHMKIRVNGICPGYIDTPMWRRELETSQDRVKRMEQVLSLHLTDRIGTAADIGRVCMFLSSADAAFVNGHVMVVDGGVTTRLHAPM